VLVAGGDSGGLLGGAVELSTSTNSTAGAEVYVAGTDAFLGPSTSPAIGSLKNSREASAPAVVPINQKTLIAGGSNCFPQAINYQSDPTTNPIASIAPNGGTEVLVSFASSENYAASPGNTVVISGVTDPTYDGTFHIDTIVDSTDFTYSDPALSQAQAASSGGSALENPDGACGTTAASGFECDALATAELYDEASRTFSLAGAGSGMAMTTERSGATATLLGDGVSVLLTGGSSGSTFTSLAVLPPGCGPVGQVSQNTAEIYNSMTDTFSATVPIPGCPGPGEKPTDPSCSGTFMGDALPTVCFSQPTAITSASESGNTVTLHVAAVPSNLIATGGIQVANVSQQGYNGDFVVGTVVGTTITYNVPTAGLTPVGAGGTAQAAGTAQCGLVDSAAVLLQSGMIPGGVLVTGGDYITFLGQSSQQSFVYMPSGPAWAPAGPLNVARELPGSVSVPTGLPAACTGAGAPQACCTGAGAGALCPSSEILVAGGLSSAAASCVGLPTNCTGAGTPNACCTGAGVGAACGPVTLITDSSAEYFNPNTFGFTLTSGSSATPGAAGGMHSGRIATVELINSGVDAGEAIDFAGANAHVPTFGTCSALTGITQQSQKTTDLYNAATTVFTAAGSLTVDRAGYGAAVGSYLATHSGGTAADLVAIGGSCSEGSLSSAPIGTMTASINCHAVKYQSDYYELFHAGATPFTGTWVVGCSPSNAACLPPTGYAPAAAPQSNLLP
jgi:hypothetical protein